MEQNRIIELLEEQNTILREQLNEQKIINQQIFEMLKTLNLSLQVNSMAQNKQTMPEDELSKAFR